MLSKELFVECTQNLPDVCISETGHYSGKQGDFVLPRASAKPYPTNCSLLSLRFCEWKMICVPPTRRRKEKDGRVKEEW